MKILFYINKAETFLCIHRKYSQIKRKLVKILCIIDIASRFCVLIICYFFAREVNNYVEFDISSFWHIYCATSYIEMIVIQITAIYYSSDFNIMISNLQTIERMFKNDKIPFDNKRLYTIYLNCALFVSLCIHDVYCINLITNFYIFESLLIVSMWYITAASHLLQILLTTTIFGIINNITCNFNKNIEKLIIDITLLCKNDNDNINVLEKYFNINLQLQDLFIVYNHLVSACQTCNKVFGFQVRYR